MDLTNLFRACVKTVRLRNKTTHDKNRILRPKHRDDFLLKANEVKYQVTQLKDLLVENRAAYMRFGYHLKTATHMTNMERDIIDLESEKIIMICNQYLNDLKRNILNNHVQPTQRQLNQHKLAILDILSDYLKYVLQMHDDQRKNRTQHEMDTLRLLKLESRNLMVLKLNGHRKDIISNKSLLDGNDAKIKPNSKKEINTVPGRIAIMNNIEDSRKIALDEDQGTKSPLEDDIPYSDDMQLFESENIQMLRELRGLKDEVEQIEKNVVGIAKLQEIFTEKVNLSIGFL